MSKIELLKQLEYMTSFQIYCLSNEKWEDFDIEENKKNNWEKNNEKFRYWECHAPEWYCEIKKKSKFFK